MSSSNEGSGTTLGMIDNYTWSLMCLAYVTCLPLIFVFMQAIHKEEDRVGGGRGRGV